jgi:DNA topoisomerase IB
MRRLTVLSLPLQLVFPGCNSTSFYWADFKSKEMRVRQRAVALYFIDKLALRAGNEKEEDQVSIL